LSSQVPCRILRTHIWNINTLAPSAAHTGIISRIKQSKNQNIWLTVVGQGVVDLIPGIMACISTKEETLIYIGRIKVKVILKLSVYMP